MDFGGKQTAGEVLDRIRRESRDESEKGRWFEQLFLRLAIQDRASGVDRADGRDIGIRNHDRGRLVMACGHWQDVHVTSHRGADRRRLLRGGFRVHRDMMYTGPVLQSKPACFALADLISREPDRCQKARPMRGSDHPSTGSRPRRGAGRRRAERGAVRLRECGNAAPTPGRWRGGRRPPRSGAPPSECGWAAMRSAGPSG